MWVKNLEGQWGSPGGDDGTGNNPTLDPPLPPNDGSGEPGIPGDGDDNGDPDNDKDGIVDTNDRYPDDDKRSEDIPVKFYGVIDLSQYQYQGQPLPTGTISHLAIDDGNSVSWRIPGEPVITTTGDVHAQGGATTMTATDNVIVSWSQGAIASVTPWRNYYWTTTFIDQADAANNWSDFYGEEYRISGLLGSGQPYGSHHRTGQAKYFRTLPGEHRVPDALLLPEMLQTNVPDNWAPWEDDQLEMVGLRATGYLPADSAHNLPETMAGSLSYVEHKEDTGYIYHGKIFRRRGEIEEYFPEGNVQPGPLSRSALVVNFRDEPPVSASAFKRIVVWTNGGAQTELSAPTGLAPDARWTPPVEPRLEPKALNDQSLLVGAIAFGWENPTANFPDPTSPTGMRKGRGDLGFLWSPTGGMQIFHDLLPEKFRKQMKDAVPFLITNPPNPGEAVKIAFTAESWEGEAKSGAWVSHTFTMTRLSDSDCVIDIVGLPQTYDSATGHMREIGASLSAFNILGVFAGIVEPPVSPPTSSPTPGAAPPPPPQALAQVPGLLQPIIIRCPELDEHGVEKPNKWKEVNSLNIARWENAYDPSNGEVRPAFIDTDPDRFYIRTPNLGVIPTIEISTDGPDHDYNDNAYRTLMIVPSNDPKWISSVDSHILVSDRGDDFHWEQGAGNDETALDRTHKAQIGGKVHFDVTFNGVKSRSSVSVPSDPWLPVKTVLVHCVIFRNHATGTSGNTSDVPCHIADVREDIEKRVKERYGQAGIVVKMDDSPEYMDPPAGVFLGDGLSLYFPNNKELAKNTEIGKISAWVEGFQNAEPVKRLWVFYVNKFTGNGPLGVTPGFPEEDKKPMPNIFISVDRHKPYVTAHEIGHALGVANWAFNHGYGSSEFWSSQSHVMNPDPIGDVDQVIASKRFPREQIMTMRNSPFARAK